MHLLFLDEAGGPTEPDFVLGGVAFQAAGWNAFRGRWREIAATNNRDPDAEVKWSKTTGGGKMAHDFIALLRESGATAFAVVLLTEEGQRIAPELFASQEDTYATALMFIAERFQRFLDEVDSYGVIVIDHRNDMQDDRLRRFFARLVENGTPFRSLERIIDPILMSPSHQTLGIQAADLVVGPMLTTGRARPLVRSAARQRLAQELHQELLPCFARHPQTGEIEGVGIKRFPQSPQPASSGRLFDLRTIV